MRPMAARPHLLAPAPLRFLHSGMRGEGSVNDFMGDDLEAVDRTQTAPSEPAFLTASEALADKQYVEDGDREQRGQNLLPLQERAYRYFE